MLISCYDTTILDHLAEYFLYLAAAPLFWFSLNSSHDHDFRRIGSDRVGSGRCGVDRVRSGWVGSGRVRSGWAGPGVGLGWVGYWSGRVKSSQVGLGRVGSVRVGSGQVVPGRVVGLSWVKKKDGV